MLEPQLLEACKARVGTSLRGKWTLERLLGVGAMAAVYVGVHKIGRKDAIKILHPHVARSSEVAARFEQEAHAVNKFHHPGAVEISDIDVSEDGCPFLVMELLEGEDLGRMAERLGGVPTERLLALVDELLDVLAAAHGQGIVHRDVKLENLFVTHEGRLKVLDFGIARVRSGTVQTLAGSKLGTTSYMAPEQVRGEGVDQRADLFSVGATMFRLLAKRRIHEATSDIDLSLKMAREPAPRLSTVVAGVDPRLAMVVDRALEFRAQDRYPSAAAMQGDVRALRAGASPPFASERLKPLAPSPAALAPTAAAPPAPALAPPAAALAPTAPTGPQPPASPVNVNTTMPSAGVGEVVAQARQAMQVAAVPAPRPAEPAARPLPGTMPSSAIGAAVLGAKAATPQAMATPLPIQPTLPMGDPRTPARNDPRPPPNVVAVTAPPWSPPRHSPQERQHASPPGGGLMPTPGGIPTPPAKVAARRSELMLPIVVGIVCLLIGSIGFYVWVLYARGAAEAEETDSSEEEKPKKKSTKSAKPVATGSATPRPTPSQPGAVR